MLKAIATLLLASLAAPAATYHFGAIWDGAKVWKDSCVTTEGERIAGSRCVHGTAIDLTRYTAIPGLIDVHTHLTYVAGESRRSIRAFGSDRVPGQENALKTLETGVTTVRDLGAADYADIAMRDLIAQGQMPGPRMFVAGYGLLITRGRTPSPNTADGVTEVLHVVRQQVAAGADVIKNVRIHRSGRDVTGFQTFTFEEIPNTCMDRMFGNSRRRLSWCSLVVASHTPLSAVASVCRGV